MNLTAPRKCSTMFDMQHKEATLDDVYDVLLKIPASDVPTSMEEVMSDEAWDLWSRALFNYPDSVTPKSVLDSYVQEVEYESDGGLY